MGLYLCIFDDDEDIDGVEVGSYADFNALRDCVSSELESGEEGSKFPTLILHSDCEGTWSVEECLKLEKELRQIAEAFKRLPPIPFNSPWQQEVAKRTGHQPKNLFESFIDVDGELLIDKIIELAQVAQRKNLEITFQ
jgi:hypothetical protein